MRRSGLDIARYRREIAVSIMAEITQRLRQKVDKAERHEVRPGFS